MEHALAATVADRAALGTLNVPMPWRPLHVATATPGGARLHRALRGCGTGVVGDDDRVGGLRPGGQAELQRDDDSEGGDQ